MEFLRISIENDFIHTDEKLEILLGELEELEWQIILLSETRAADHNRELHGGHRLITCLGATPYAGIGILVHSMLKAQILRIHNVNGRICAIDLQWLRACVRIVAVYLPHAGYDRISDEALNEFYEELYVLILDTTRKGMRLIIHGDFNTVFKLDKRGELLDQLLEAFNLKIVNDPEGLSFENRWTHT